jgi:hypothetical protein
MQIPPSKKPPIESIARPDTKALALGPELPMAAYYALERWNPDRIGALVLYCSDGRWGEAFDEFCHRHLHIPRYDRWAVPGGPAALIPRPEDPNAPQIAHPQLDFLVRVHELEQIVLITHFGCAVYAELLKKSPDECLPIQFKEAAVASATLRKWYPQLKVQAFLAMRHESCVSFHELCT